MILWNPRIWIVSLVFALGTAVLSIFPLSAGSFFSTGSLRLPDRDAVSEINVQLSRSKEDVEIIPMGIRPSDSVDAFRKSISDRERTGRIMEILARESDDWQVPWHTTPYYFDKIELVTKVGAKLTIRFRALDCNHGGYFQADGVVATTVQKQFSSENCKDLMMSLSVPKRFWRIQ